MSSDSESDEEFVPGAPEQLSEEDSADEETDLQFEREQEHTTKKRKAAQEKATTKKRRTRNNIKEPTPEPEAKEPEPKLNREEEKKREDDLWAMFLDGTDTKPKAAPKETTTVTHTAKPVEKATTHAESNSEDNKARERRIFEFAGETIVVENNVIKEKVKTAESVATGSKPVPQLSRGRTSGLKDVIGQLNKKNQLSTLEKSKLDWETYKKEQDIAEEVQNHNKGKNGYLDRQDFLERADHRQYEIERDMRLNRRSNR